MKLKSILKDKKAVTLIELIIAITILAIILPSLVYWFSTMTGSTNKTTAESLLKDQAGKALEIIVKDMRNSSAESIQIYSLNDTEVALAAPTITQINFNSAQDFYTGRIIKANNYWYRIFCYDTNPTNPKYALYRYHSSISSSGAMPTTNRDNYKFAEDIFYDPANVTEGVLNPKYGLQIILLKDEPDDSVKTYKVILNLKRRVGADIITQDVETTISKSVIED